MFEGQIPTEVMYLWNWYCQISNRGNFNHTEILSWATLYKIQITPQEVDALFELHYLKLEAFGHD